GADLFVKYPLSSRLFLFGGPSVSYILKRDTSQTEVINSPSFAVFKDMNSRERPVISGRTPQYASIFASLSLGASLDIPLSEKVMLAPELSGRMPLTSLRSDYTWKVWTV